MPLCGIAWSCVAAAFFSVGGDVLMFAALAMHMRRSDYANDWDKYKQLDPTTLQSDWEVRRDSRPLDTAAGMFNAVAWIVFLVPGLHLVWKLSRGGQHLVGMHTTMGVLLLLGACVEFVSQIMFIGTFNTMEWISSDFNLDYWVNDASSGNPDETGWRALEVCFISIRGMLLWVDAVEWLFLGFFLFLMFLSIQRQLDDTSKFVGLPFGRYGMVLSWLCLVEFSFEVLRFESWRTFSIIIFYITLGSRLILWPLFFLWLGRILALAQARGGSHVGGGSEAEMMQYATDRMSAPPPTSDDINSSLSDENLKAQEEEDGNPLT